MTKIIPKGVPTLVITISESRVNKLHKRPLPISKAGVPASFWTFINSWGGNWMWREISNGNKPKDDMQWVADGMMAGTLIWTTDGSYDRKKATDLLGVGWIIFCKATGQQLMGSFWEQSITAACLEQKCLVYVRFTSLQERFLNIILSEDGQPLCAETTRGHLHCPPITMGGYVQAQSAQIFDGASRPPNKRIKGDQVHPFLWTHGPTSFMGATLPYSAAQLRM
jgi:hypothetical protein